MKVEFRLELERYFDGELSPERHAEVARLLSGSARRAVTWTNWAAFVAWPVVMNSPPADHRRGGPSDLSRPDRSS